jgi:hypothetical protein
MLITEELVIAATDCNGDGLKGREGVLEVKVVHVLVKFAKLKENFSSDV